MHKNNNKNHVYNNFNIYTNNINNNIINNNNRNNNKNNKINKTKPCTTEETPHSPTTTSSRTMAKPSQITCYEVVLLLLLSNAVFHFVQHGHSSPTHLSLAASLKIALASGRTGQHRSQWPGQGPHPGV